MQPIDYHDLYGAQKNVIRVRHTCQSWSAFLSCKTVLLKIWNLPQEFIDAAIVSILFRELQSCVAAADRRSEHFEY